MGKESSLWKNINRKMKGMWHAERIESMIGKGVPDVYYTLACGTMGWLELKYKKEWPKKASTVVRLRHFTSEQRNWIRLHGNAGGNVKILIQVDRHYLLFNHEAHSYLGRCSRIPFYSQAIKVWKNSIKADELYDALKR